MKIADYGKAITSYIESPTTAQKLKSKESANLLAEVDFSGMSLPALKIYYERETGLPAPKDSRQLIIELKRLMKGLDEDGVATFSTGGRVHLAEGSEDIVEPSKSMQVDTTTKGLDLFTLQDFKDKAEIYVGAYHNNALPIDDIKSALNKFTQKGIDDGTFTADEAIKVVQDFKSYFVDMAQKQRLREVVPEGIGTVKRKDFQDGLSVQTLDPVFPTQDPTSTDFKPLDLPGALIPPLAIGAGAKRFKDIFFSKKKGDDKKEIIPSDDKRSDIEPPKGPKFELKDVLTESIFESMRDPENRNKVKNILNEQKNFFSKKNKDIKTIEKFIKSVENKAITLPGQQTYKQPVFNKDYLTLFKNYVDQNHGGNLSKAISELGINVDRRTIQRRFQETNMGTFEGATAKALLDIEPGTSTYTDVMETMKSNPKEIFSEINLKIKNKNLSKNSYVESIDLANLLGIDGMDNEQRNQFLKRLRKLEIRTQSGTQGGKAKKYHLGDVLSELAFYTKNERQALAGDAEDYVALRKKREVNLGLDKINSALRKNITSRLENTDIIIPKISLAEDMGHAESVELIEKYPNLFKGSNVKSLQTLVRQDPVINQTILVDNGYHSKNDAIYKQLKNKKINIAEANNLLKLNNERIRRIIKNEARDNPFFRNQENRIALLQIDKNGIVNADMSTVDPFYIYGNINEVNSKANKVSDLSKEEINIYLGNLKNQWTDGAVKFISNFKDKQGNRIYSNEEIEEFKDIIALPSGDTATKYKFQKGGPVYGKYARQIAKLS